MKKLRKWPNVIHIDMGPFLLVGSGDYANCTLHVVRKDEKYAYSIRGRQFFKTEWLRQWRSIFVASSFCTIFFGLVVEMKHSCLLPKKFTSSLSGSLKLCSPWIIALLELKATTVTLQISPCFVLQMEMVRSSLHTSPKQDDASRIELLPIQWQPSFCKSAFDPIRLEQRSRATG